MFLQVTAWIPLIDANKENGIIYLSKVIIMTICIYFLKDVYKYYVVVIVQVVLVNIIVVLVVHGMLKYLLKKWQSSLDIPVNEQTVVTCEVPFGSVLFLNNLIPHKSTENYSQNIRWSLDLRW